MDSLGLPREVAAARTEIAAAQTKVMAQTVATALTVAQTEVVSLNWQQRLRQGFTNWCEYDSIVQEYLSKKDTP